MKKLILSAGLLLLAACGTTSYGPYGLNRGYGGDRPEPGMYRTSGHTTPRTRSGFAAEMALYRAAEMAREDGFQFIQVVHIRGGAMVWGSAAGGMMMSGTSGEEAFVRARGVESMTAPLRCEMGDSDQCRNLDIGELMARLGPRLGISGPR
jgi:hypothetical protein